MPREATLDNQFYGVLTGNSYQQEMQDSDNILWRRVNARGRLFMLNADMALIANMENFIDPDTGVVSCTLSETCPESSLMEFTNEFARSNNAWLSAFHDAYIKMTNVGCGNTCRPVVA